MKTNISDRGAAEARFAEVFAHLEFLVAYARRRGSRDPDAIAAEAMAIAWRRLPDVPRGDARPWLIATTRNLLLAEHRRGTSTSELDGLELAAPEQRLGPALDFDPELDAALRALPPADREALLLVAWEDLTPAMAAESLGISATAFRMRLLRARRRLSAGLTARPLAQSLSPRPDWSRS
jgi:RNA polymerase sigma-70 factor, ECF subfamily